MCFKLNGKREKALAKKREIGCMTQMIFLSYFPIFSCSNASSEAKKKICLCERKQQKFQLKFPIKHSGGTSFFCCHGIMTPLHLIHFIPYLHQLFLLLLPFIAIFVVVAAALFSVVCLSFLACCFSFTVLFNSATKKNKFLLLVPFTKVTFIKYTFRSFSGTMLLDSL